MCILQVIKGRIDARTTKIGLLPNPSGITTMTQNRPTARPAPKGDDAICSSSFTERLLFVHLKCV
jgi:hypothetical protein